MAGQIVNDQNFYDIANAIRRINGESTLYRPQDMANVILDLPDVYNITPEMLSVMNKTITTLDDSTNREIKNVRGDAFLSCSALTTVKLPACTTIETDAFRSCTSLTTVNLPVCTSIGITAFRSCTSLTTVNLPVCTSIGAMSFDSCTSLTTVNLPACTFITIFAFSGCTSLTTVNLPACTEITSGAFSGCTSLTSITLSSSTVCKLSFEDAFEDTPIASGNGYIYVPANLVDTYKAASRWSTYANQIVAIPS